MRLLAVVVVAALIGCGGEQGLRPESGATTTTAPTTTTTIGEDPLSGEVSLTVRVVSAGDLLREATLTCGGDPTGTGHLADAAARAACELLRTNPLVVSLLVSGREPGMMCTQQYGGPEEATVKGTIDGRPVDASINRRDGCGIAEWNLLTPLLGPPGT
jgi:hypothetical protein